MLWLVVCCFAVDGCVLARRVALSEFGHRTVRRYNNTHCTYGVNPQHEGSISELHYAKSFFSRAGDRTLFLQRIIVGACTVRRGDIQNRQVSCVEWRLSSGELSDTPRRELALAAEMETERASYFLVLLLLLGLGRVIGNMT
jgi:hypothetical protein